MELRLEKTDIVYYELDLETGIIKCHGDTVKLTGYTEEEISYMGIDAWKKSIHPMERLDVYEFITDSIGQSTSFTIEFRFRKKEGLYIWMEIQGVRICEINGCYRVVGMCKNIMPKKAKVDERKFKYNMLTMLYEWHQEATMCIDVTSQILECTLKYIYQINSIDVAFVCLQENENLKIAASLGIDKMVLSDLKDAKINSCIAAVTLKTGEPVVLNMQDYPDTPVKEIFQNEGITSLGNFPVYSNGENFGFIVIGMKESGALRKDTFDTIQNMCNQTATLLKKNQLYQRVKEELEARTKAEKELKLRAEEIEKSRSDLKTILNNTESAMWRTDKSGHYVMCEGRAMESAGFKKEHLIGNSIFDVFQYSTDQGKGLQNALDGMTGEYEVSINKCSLAVSSAPLYNDIGDLEGIAGVAVDITRHKETEDRNMFLEQIIKLEGIRTDFFANISHELRTPINVILSSVQLIEKTILPRIADEKLKKYLNTTRVNGYRLLRLINNIIDVTKIDTGFFEKKFCNTNIISVIEEVTSSVANYIEGKGISLTFDTETEERMTACDIEKLERVMLNLLSNAVKYTNKGGQILVNIYDRENAILIAVKDDGVGISKEYLNKIFERFTQGDPSLSRRCEGSGIGLSLVKSIVEMHGGHLYIKSEVGEGTEVIAEIPIRIREEYGFIIENKWEEEVMKKKINIEFADIYN